MCVQVSKKILFKQAAYQTGEIPPIIRYSDWKGIEDLSNGNVVYVELRAIDMDYILESWVIVDGETMVDSKTVLNGWSQEYDHIRKAIKTFDELLASHPMIEENAKAIKEFVEA